MDGDIKTDRRRTGLGLVNWIHHVQDKELTNQADIVMLYFLDAKFLQVVPSLQCSRLFHYIIVCIPHFSDASPMFCLCHSA
jgi:hypothetical protein